LKVKSFKRKSKNSLIIWIQRTKSFEQDIQQLLDFFKEQVQVKEIRRIYHYYRVTSENPAIILSLFSAIQESLPEIYFNNDFVESEELII
jgi:hypothetical protein